MAVKTLNDLQKDNIVSLYQAKTKNQKELAILYQTSERTINRVLNERGLATAVPRLKGEAAQAMKVLQAWKLTPALLQLLLAGLEDIKMIICNEKGITVNFGWATEYKPSVDRNHKERDELRPIEQVKTDKPWRVSEHYGLFSRDVKELRLSVGQDAIKQHASDNNFIRWVAGSNLTSKPVTKGQVVDFCMRVPEEEWASILNEIVTARVAQASVTHTQTTMLNITNKVEQNARESEQQRRK